MYTFSIKDNGPDIQVVLSRGLLALSAIVCLFYGGNGFFLINIIAAVLLLTMAGLCNLLCVKFKITNLLILIAGAIILFAATRSFILPIVLPLFGWGVKKILKQPFVSVNTNGVHFHNTIGSTAYRWKVFNNIILKDNLLTLDFKNNKLMQLTVMETGNTTDEGSFNNFCSGCIGI